MTRPRTVIATLAVLLVISNVWWVYRSLDDSLTRHFLREELRLYQASLTQVFAILSVALKDPADRAAILKAGRESTTREGEPFEKDGYVWIGELGLKFGPDNRLLSVVGAWKK